MAINSTSGGTFRTHGKETPGSPIEQQPIGRRFQGDWARVPIFGGLCPLGRGGRHDRQRHAKKNLHERLTFLL